MHFLNIQKQKSTPKYKQIVGAIERAIDAKQLAKGDMLPSLNAIRDKHKVSRDTVLNAFQELKMRGIIRAVVGKGYFVESDNIHVSRKIFLLFDELNAFKEDLYNAFVEALPNNTQVEIFFHHFNHKLFSKLISDSQGNYHHYVVMPSNLPNTRKIIDQLPHNRVYILDQMQDELRTFSGVYQNFEKDMFQNLMKISTAIQKYQHIILVFNSKFQPKGMRLGYEKFCYENQMAAQTLPSLTKAPLLQNAVYIIPDDKNLILMIKKIKDQKMVLTKDIGIISYNETLLKEVVEGGITTISTDFKRMGQLLAEMILHKKKLNIENQSILLRRASI